MQAWLRLISMVLVITLAGGAQACVALCAAPAQKAQPAAATAPAKSSCHHCPEKGTLEKPVPAEPAGPCKHCHSVTQDRLAAERDGSVLKAAFELSLLPFVEFPGTVAPAVDRPFEVTRPPVDSPPGERLHQFCLLLI
jgi:hypothetical protein